MRTDSGRSVFVTVDSGGNNIGRTVSGLKTMRNHPGRCRVNQPLARFVWTTNDELAWGVLQWRVLQAGAVSARRPINSCAARPARLSVVAGPSSVKTASGGQFPGRTASR